MFPELVAEGLSDLSTRTIREAVETRVDRSRTAGAASGANPTSVQINGFSVLLCAAPDNATFANILSADFMSCLEVPDGADAMDIAGRLAELIDQGKWFTSVSCRRIFKTAFVAQLCGRIAAEDSLGDGECDLMRTAIDEALSNAVIHGNLELQSAHTITIADFADFYAQVDERIAMSEYGNRRITVQTWRDETGRWVSIADEGSGYEPRQDRRDPMAVAHPDRTHERRRNGRGMEIIESLSREFHTDLGGRCISMRFGDA